MAGRFADTNILLYAISTDPSERTKAETASRILGDRGLRVSVQVLQEFFVQATRSGRTDALSHDQAARLVRSFWRFRPLELTKELVGAAMDGRARFGISYWDAAIVEAARAAGCPVLLSEDLKHGQDYGGVRVEDPFRQS